MQHSEDSSESAVFTACVLALGVTSPAQKTKRSEAGRMAWRLCRTHNRCTTSLGEGLEVFHRR